ncbi:MAG: hypothetical protein ACFE9V_19890, partial [Candidatus Hodarchaeota archaeon]
MQKSFSKILLSGVMVLIVLSLVGSVNVRAIETPDQTVTVQGDTIQTQLQSNIRTMFWFQERTKLTICANVGLELNINCDAIEIGYKDVIIEVEGDDDLKMTMKCTREEAQLGLMNGSLHRVRNRNTYRYFEGFCITMKSTAICCCECKCDPKCVCSCNCVCNCESECPCICDCPCECEPVCNCECDCQCKCDSECKCNSECPHNGTFLKARLRIRETNQNRLSQWAYYNNESEEWYTIPTTNQDGYLTAETSILSTWTLLVPEETTVAIIDTSAITVAIIFASV